MFRSFHIQNFRCFRDLKLDNLERVNLIAGQNNVGKTALLEAIFLHLGPNNPGLGDTLNQLRGAKRTETRSAEDVWGALFPLYDITKTIELASQDNLSVERTLEVSLAETDITRYTQPQDQADRMVASIITAIPERELLLDYHDTTGQHAQSRARPSVDGVGYSRIGTVVSVIPVQFISTSTRSADAELFSNLVRVGREEEVLSALSLIEPRLRRLTVLVSNGVPTIHGDIGPTRLIPLTMMGEGMRRFLSSVLAIANTEHGVVLIDEVENGLHYSVMAKVWAAIAQAARAADVQIFATTHSWECITAAHQAFSESETYDFRLHRLDRIGEDIRAVTLNQKMLDTAIQSGLEVR